MFVTLNEGNKNIFKMNLEWYLSNFICADYVMPVSEMSASTAPPVDYPLDYYF